jgi:Zn-dependent M28 family amino/carboxypeptidase
MTRTRVAAGVGLVVLLGAGVLGGQAAVIDRAQLLKDLEVLAADEMQGREVGTPGGARARAYILERFKASGIPPVAGTYEHSFSLPGSARTSGAVRGVNIIGRIAGRERPERHLVLSAHYDHAGVRRGQVFNGANDNASGTAAIIALGHYFSTRALRHSLVIAAFDSEESGLAGSRAFVKAGPIPAASIVLNLNADMVGRDASNRLYVSGTFEQPALKGPVERVARRAPVTLLMGYDNPKSRAIDYWMRMSDQWSFREAGLPALYIGVEDFEHLHRPSDDYANMTHEFFVNAVETIRLLIEEFDKALD